MSDVYATEQAALISALEFYIDSGARDFCENDANDMSEWSGKTPSFDAPPMQPQAAAPSPIATIQNISDEADSSAAALGKSEMVEKAKQALKDVHTLDELQNLIQNFDSLGIKKTATNIIFAEGDPKADLMIISDIPNTDEDRTGKPFAGESRRIMDLALGALGYGIDAGSDKTVYTTSFLNWRPPGNRSPQDGEIEVSRLFLDKHIALVQPKVIFLFGNVANKAMLGCKTNINKLRGNWQSFKCECDEKISTPLMPSFHPSAIMGSAKHKKLFWQDMLEVVHKLRDEK